MAPNAVTRDLDGTALGKDEDSGVDETRHLRLVVLAPSGLGGGAELVLIRFLSAAMTRGWTLTCYSPKGHLAGELTALGIPTVAIPDLRLPSGPRVVGALRLSIRNATVAIALRRAVTGADGILVNGIHGLLAVALVRPRPPVILLVHEVVRRRDRILWLHLLRGNIDAAITVSHASAAALADAGVAARVVPNGTPWPVPRAPSTPPSPPVVGCVGALTPGKGQHVLLQALSQLQVPDVEVELVGQALPKDQAYVETLRAQAAAYGLGDRVRFSGRVANPLDRVRGWTAAVLPSLEPESFGLALLEAMSVGVPVVGTDHGGTPEVLGDCGLLVPPGDATALAAAVTRLISEGDLRRRCSDAGIARVAEHYPLAERTDELLDAVAASMLNPRPGAGKPATARGHGRACSHGMGTGTTTVIAVPDFEPTMGGTSRQARNLAVGQTAHGREVLVVTRRRQRSWPAEERRQGVSVVRFASPGSGRLGDKLSVVALAAWLVRHRRGVGSVQVVMYPDFVLSCVAAGLGPRTVLIWAGLGDATDVLGATSDRLRTRQRSLRRQALSRCHHVALSAAIADELTGLGLHGASLAVIPVPIDTTRFHPPCPQEREHARGDIGLAEGELAVIYTGHFRALKGLDRLVEAFRRLVANGCHARLLLVGGGDAPDACEEQIRAQVKACGLLDQVSFLGIVGDVERYLWAADVFVLPSRREGMSNSLVEAMACGLACVAGAEAGGDEALRDGAGVIPTSNEAEDLFVALSDLAGDPPRRRDLGKVAAARAREWSIPSIGGRYHELLAQVEEP